MKAVQFHGKEDIRVNEVPLPVVGPGHVRIRPAFVGICGTGMFIRIFPFLPHTTYRI
jgi:threonine dehydrogenase-like Zn-dependent dehydrogenase